MQLKVRNAEQAGGGSGQGRLPPGPAGRFMLFMLGLGVLGGAGAYAIGRDLWETNYPTSTGPIAPTPASPPPGRNEKTLR